MKLKKTAVCWNFSFGSSWGETISVKAVANGIRRVYQEHRTGHWKIQEFLAEHRDLIEEAELVYSYKDKAYHLNCEEFLKIRNYLHW